MDVQAHQPRLLILDPLIRLHRLDENGASQIAALLSYLRRLQRAFRVAILVVHHARKDANTTRPTGSGLQLQLAHYSHDYHIRNIISFTIGRQPAANPYR